MTIESVLMVISIIMSNIGARYIIMDIDRKHYSKYFGHKYMTYVYIFCMSYLGSRDLYLSILFAILYSFV